MLQLAEELLSDDGSQLMRPLVYTILQAQICEADSIGTRDKTVSTTHGDLLVEIARGPCQVLTSTLGGVRRCRERSCLWKLEAKDGRCSRGHGQEGLGRDPGKGARVLCVVSSVDDAGTPPSESSEAGGRCNE